MEDKKQKEKIYMGNTNFINPTQVQQNINQNGVETKEQNPFLTIIYLAITLIIAAIAGFGAIWIRELPDKFNQITGGEIQATKEEKNWWE